MVQRMENLGKDAYRRGSQGRGSKRPKTDLAPEFSVWFVCYETHNIKMRNFVFRTYILINTVLCICSYGFSFVYLSYLQIICVYLNTIYTVVHLCCLATYMYTYSSVYNTIYNRKCTLKTVQNMEHLTIQYYTYRFGYLTVYNIRYNSNVWLGKFYIQVSFRENW